MSQGLRLYCTMSLITLLVILVVIGIVTWLVTTYIPMPASIKNIILVVAIIVCLFVVLNAFGVLSTLQGVRVPQVK